MKPIKFFALTVSILAAVFVVHFAQKDCQAVDYSKFNETARFLAGKPVAKDSKLRAFAKTRYYKKYARSIIKGWNHFQKPNLAKMKKWWQKYKPSNTTETIYYPFSGPDIINALSLYPNGKTYIMFGLEPPGKTPNPYSMKHWQIRKGLYGIKKSVSFIFNYKFNFFRTNDMRKDLGTKSFNSITGVLMFFLALNDYEIVNVKRVAIDEQSKLVNWKPSDDRIHWKRPSKEKRIPGVEIAFRKNGTTRTIRYFNLNVIDRSLKYSLPNFVPYILKQKPYNTVLKAASYLLHSDKFSIIRQTVEQSEFIVQDDSGMPLKYLPESKWKIKYHGYYWRPIGLFRNRYQKKLRIMTRKYSTGILPFSYGYNFPKGKSNLLTAEKKK